MEAQNFVFFDQSATPFVTTMCTTILRMSGCRTSFLITTVREKNLDFFFITRTKKPKESLKKKNTKVVSYELMQPHTFFPLFYSCQSLTVAKLVSPFAVR